MRLYIDIETIPTGEEIDPRSLQAPKNYKKKETIEEWYRTDAMEIAEERFRSRALDSMQGNILCIGFAIDNKNTNVIFSEDEEDLLSSFQDIVSELMGIYSEPIEYIGWNIRQFDIPFIWRKSVKYRLQTLKKSFNRDKGRGNAIS